MRLLVTAVALVLAISAPAFAQPGDDAVALLPLDADQKLELYSQSVASEVARALAAGQIDVVVVGPKMAVPEKARLIVDGTITGKADNVTLTLRIRDAHAATVLATVPATASSVTDATEQLSQKVVPAVKAQIAALHAQTQPPKLEGHKTVPARAPMVAEKAALLVAIHASPGAEALVAPLGKAVEPWADRKILPLANTLVDMVVPSTVQGNGFAIGFELLGYVTLPGAIPSARARVRVRIVARTGVLFDRIIHTDTVVGDKGITPEALAARTAGEVLAIVEPHFRRVDTSWRP
jgi:hypothetical protein